MTDITLTHLEPELTERLQQRASANGRTIEAEITAILESALMPESTPNEPDLATAIQQHFAEFGGVELPAIPREPIRNPPLGDTLLSHTDTWEGSDFEDCLKTVVETRSQISPTETDSQF